MTTGTATRTSPAPLERHRVGTVVGDYIKLTKPRVISLLLVTTLCAMFIAERARAALQERRRFLLALSGGRTPRPMFEALVAAMDGDATAGRTLQQQVAPGSALDVRLGQQAPQRP